MSDPTAHPQKFGHPIQSASAQAFIDAFQNFVLPLIHTTHDYNQKDTDKPCFIPSSEANKLLSALQGYITYLVNSQRDTQKQNSIEVNFDGSSSTLDEKYCKSVRDEKPPFTTPDFEDADKYEEIKDLVDPAPIHLPLVLASLREHVFNDMPIRLLCTTPTGSSLHIELLERGGIYNYLAAKLQNAYSESDFCSTMKQRLGENWDDSSLMEQERKQVIAELVKQNSKYAILSHTWIRSDSGEATYRDWQVGTARSDTERERPGYHKLFNFCKTAWTNNGIALGWMDTVCINKDSSSELDESIRSMYSWYKGAHVCIAYLSATKTLSVMRYDPWFTRGWTLQELLAPERIKFYNADWNPFVDFASDLDKFDPLILEEIFEATTITQAELQKPKGMPISRKMQLAAKREVMRKEDIAYSLMGICDVSISIAYGEGAKRAFIRLMTAILNSSAQILDMFNCATEDFTMNPPDLLLPSSIIPSSPQNYLYRSTNGNLQLGVPMEPLVLTHLGVRMPIVLVPGVYTTNQGDFPPTRPIGAYHGNAKVTVNPNTSQDPRIYKILDKRISDIRSSIGSKYMPVMHPGWYKCGNDEQVHIQIFRILNTGGDNTCVHIPTTSLAVALSESKGNRLQSYVLDKSKSMAPIIVELQRKDSARNAALLNAPIWRNSSMNVIERKKLATHGMELVNLYL